ncbi:MAG: glycosyltransferase [Bacteroidetes bacterium]|nr:glycosyltransferase [Bacteroidota bacterium]
MLPLASKLHSFLCLVLDEWRANGRHAALDLWADVTKSIDQDPGHPLVRELDFRLNQRPGPRLLIDGIWFSRPYGGITRVWEQILSTFALDGFLSDEAPVSYLDRDTRLAICTSLDPILSPPLDPFDYPSLQAAAITNAELAEACRADVFISSWITFCPRACHSPNQIALVHDCIPERSLSAHPELVRLRRQWMDSSAGRLCVSRNTLNDVARFHPRPNSMEYWCHPSPTLSIQPPVLPGQSYHKYWQEFSLKASIRNPFLLLPGTSSIGSYKNPEVVARALATKGLQDVQLIITGINSSQYASDLTQLLPTLQSRILALGATSLELQELYRHAFAVVVPSRIEGFGLPVVEALSTNPCVLISDAPGLREAGGSAAIRFAPEDHHALASLLLLLRDSSTRQWLVPTLQRRSSERLSLLHRDLFGLTLAAMARELCCRNS